MNSKVIRAAFGLAIQWGITSMYAQAPVTGAGGPVTAVPAPSRANATKVETEVIEINDFSAFPSEITRKTGKFFLLLVDKTRNTQTGLVFDAPSALFNSNPPPYGTVAQNVNGTGTLLGQGTIGSGGVISGASCSIELTNSKAHVNPNAALPDADPNASPVTDLYLDLSVTLASTAPPVNIYAILMDWAGCGNTTPVLVTQWP